MSVKIAVEKPSGLLARLALAAIGVSVLLTITIGLLGPSAVVPALGGPAWQPPYSLDAHPDPHLVIALAAAAIITGGLGLLGALLAHQSGTLRLPSRATDRASRDTEHAGGGEHAGGAERTGRAGGAGSGARSGGGRGAVWWLVLFGCVAAGVLAFLPPSGSADHLNYAVYGRMVTLGIDPYTHGAIDLPNDPIAGAVEKPWREEPSVYGPVATAVQALASWIGGDSLRLTIFVLALVNSAAFIATGLLLDRLTRGDPDRRLRAALLWTANPLLLYQLVAGLHVDTLAIACVAAALIVRARPVASGVLFGLGVAIKVNAGLVALGPAWELRRRPGRLAVMAGVALGVVVIGYALAGPQALNPVSRASKSVSWASYWKPVQGWLQTVFGSGAYRTEMQVGALIVLVLLAWALFRAVGRQADAPVVAAVLMVAYLFATPYILPWYDGFAFALIAMIAVSRLDLFVAAHLMVLSLGYLPARQAAQPADLGWLVTVVRVQLVPLALAALTVGLGWWAWRAGARARRLPEPAAPRP